MEVMPENVNGLTFEWNAKDYENTQKYHLNKCIVHLARERERQQMMANVCCIALDRTRICCLQNKEC